MYWFIHFHRSAGTSIIEMMKRENVKLYQPNENGNPSYKNGDRALLPLWDFSEEWFKKFLDYCKRINAEAFATEFGFPSHLKKWHGAITLTVMRDPLKRFISNFNFNHKIGMVDKDVTVEDFYKGGAIETSKNYYYNLLSGDGKQAPEDILRKIDCIVILEDKETFKNLDEIGLSSKLPHHHKTNKGVYKKNEEFEKKFKEENKKDYKLYKLAKELANDK